MIPAYTLYLALSGLALVANERAMRRHRPLYPWRERATLTAALVVLGAGAIWVKRVVGR